MELEVQLALDATEEGLLAIAGRSAQEFDQGLHHSHWHSALYLHKVRAKTVTQIVLRSLLYSIVYRGKF